MGGSESQEGSETQAALLKVWFMLRLETEDNVIRWRLGGKEREATTPRCMIRTISFLT